MSSVKVNILYNWVLTGANYIFPLITFPYVSRTLGVSNIGLCGYVDSIINYLVLFSALGIFPLGVREIAKNKGDKNEMSKLFSSLVSINLTLTSVCAIGLVCLILFVEAFYSYRTFLWIGLFKLIFSAFSIEWFFQGISEFKYITLRSLLVKSTYVVLVFLLVRNEADVYYYYAIICGTVVLNSTINWRYSRRFVSFSLKSISIMAYVIPVFSYGLYRILTSLYTTFNVTYLGMVNSDTEVGYYVTATKTYTILMAGITAVTTVLVPKVSEYLHKKDYARLNKISYITFQQIFTFSLPIIAVSYFYAPLIIWLIAGDGYQGAVTPFRIVMSLLLIIALEQVITQQFLLATKNTGCIVTLSITGAVVGVSVNYLMTAHLGAIGSAISWTVSEIAVLLMGIFFFYKYLNEIKLPFGLLTKYALLCIPYIAIGLLLNGSRLAIKPLIGIALCGVWFVISNTLVVKNEQLLSLVIRKRTQA